MNTRNSFVDWGRRRRKKEKEEEEYWAQEASLKLGIEYCLERRSLEYGMLKVGREGSEKRKGLEREGFHRGDLKVKGNNAYLKE